MGLAQPPLLAALRASRCHNIPGEQLAADVSEPTVSDTLVLIECGYSVFDGMTQLCKEFFPKELKAAQDALKNPFSKVLSNDSLATDGDAEDGEEEEEEEEEEET